ncbi:MAG: YIEGIA domain-containing protein [Clostridioides sp.]|jgi:hypothetical protein|nr:YIEGIA domain-containing protein [Clostridioides sp.]
MEKSLLSDEVLRQVLIVSVLVGIFCRGFVLVVIDKQYPSRPQDYIEQIISSGLSAALGAIALPALLDEEYAALTFFAIAIQQFQGLAEQERITLKNTDQDEIVPKGEAYVEEISSTYESRSYISLISALAASITYITINLRFVKNFWICTVGAIISGIIVGIIFRKYLKRKSVEDIADIFPAEINFEDSVMKVNGVYIANVGLSDTRKKYTEKGLAIEIFPKEPKYFGILNDIGQRQSIIHNIYIHLGINKDIDEYDILSISRTSNKTKSVIIVFVPILKDMQAMIKAAQSAPILEVAKTKEGYAK